MKALILFTLTLFIGFDASSQGVSFTEVNSGSDVDLRCVFFVDDEIGYTAGRSEFLYKTIDGGDSWTANLMLGLAIGGGLEQSIIDLYFVSELEGYAIQENTYGIRYTEDGGNNWSLIEDTPGNMCFPKDLEILENGTQSLIGSGCFQGAVYAFNEDGEWPLDATEFETDEYVHALSQDFLDNQTGIVGTAGGLTFRTADGGETWEMSSIPDVDSITGITYVNAQTILASTTDTGSALYISEDGGQTWDFEGASLTFFYPRLNGVITGLRNVIFGKAETGGQGFVSYQTNGELNWDYQSFDPELNAGFTTPDGTAFIVGDDGIIIRSDAPLGVYERPEKVFSVYPNPASTQLFIDGLPESDGDFNFTISNGLGQIIQQGSLSSSQIELKQMASDVYFLEIKSDKKSLGVQKVRIE